MGENIDNFDEFPAFRQHSPTKIFHLVSYLPLMLEIKSISVRRLL